ATLTLVVNVNPGTTGTLTNTACATGNETDPNAANNCGTTTTTSLVPELAIEKTGPASVQIGGVIAYTVRVTNTGTAPLHNVTIVDPKLGFSDTLATLGVGLTATYNLTYGPVTEGDLPGPIVNTATADADETGPVSDGHTVAIETSPGIALEKTAPAGPYA
ncbi:MAG: hypothetical protein AB1778_09075, partial [Candidatus Bipolaricaulota bacterium]